MGFISKFLRTKGLMNERQLQTFSQCLQELLAGERGVGAAGAARPRLRGRRSGQGGRWGGKGESGPSEAMEPRGAGSALAGSLRAVPSRPAGARCKQKGPRRPLPPPPTRPLPPQTKVCSSPGLSPAPKAQTARFPERKTLPSWVSLSSKIQPLTMSLGSPFFLEASLSRPTAPVKSKYRGFFRCPVGFAIPSLRPSGLMVATSTFRSIGFWVG